MKIEVDRFDVDALRVVGDRLRDRVDLGDCSRGYAKEFWREIVAG